MKFKTRIGYLVQLTPKRREHIISTHPIMKLYLSKLKQVLVNPDEIRHSSYRLDVLLFYRYFDRIEGGKYIVAVVDLADNVVLTAYLTHRIKIGERYEKKQEFQD